jgi:plasmid stabilization system protein ParE
MNYKVEFSRTADEDLERLFEFALQRELSSETGDLDIPDRAIQAIRNGVAFLMSSPFACRKVEVSPFVRELVIPFGSSGYVALFEVVDDQTVIIGAIRHQREDDYH